LLTKMRTGVNPPDRPDGCGRISELVKSANRIWLG